MGQDRDRANASVILDDEAYRTTFAVTQREKAAQAESEYDFKIDVTNLLSFLTKEIPFRLPLLVRFFNKRISLCHLKFFLFSCDNCQN